METFFDLITKKIHVGDNFANPGGAKPGDRGGYGYRTVKTITMDKIVYFGAGTKSESKITLPIRTFHDVILEFQSSCCYTWQLKQFRPNIFDSTARPAGHSCNCTFLMSIADKLGFLASGRGNEQIHERSHRPYWNNAGIFKDGSFYVKFKSIREIQMEGMR
jgi:hypothetical protein